MCGCNRPSATGGVLGNKDLFVDHVVKVKGYMDPNAGCVSIAGHPTCEFDKYPADLYTG